MKSLVVRTQALVGVLSLLILSACQPLLAGYSLDAFKNATSLKAEVAHLVQESDEPFSVHAAEVRALTVKIDAAYEFAAGIPDNSLSATQWNLLRGDTLFGGFVQTWRQSGTTGARYRAEKTQQISEAFDYIACLEVNKKELKHCSSKEGNGGEVR